MGHRAQIWMLVNLKKWFHAFSHNYTHHFEMQDKFFFKLLKTKARPWGAAGAAPSPGTSGVPRGPGRG